MSVGPGVHAWEPLFGGELGTRALDAVGDIIEALPEPGEGDDPSLSSGQAGLALVAAYATKAGLGDYLGTARAYLLERSPRSSGRAAGAGSTGGRPGSRGRSSISAIRTRMTPTRTWTRRSRIPSGSGRGRSST